jgi:hypothetical protein
MLDGTDPDAAERLVDDWQAGFEQRAAQARDLAGRLARLRASAHSDDGFVTVTVGPDGAMTGLELDEEVRRRPAAETARQILATLAAARADLTTQAGTVTRETVGADSETGKAVLASLARRLP